MKKFILKSLAFLTIVLFAASCSEEPNAVPMNEENVQLKGGSMWDGVIGVVQDGEYVITIPVESVKKDFENQLARQGKTISLTSIEIVDVPSQDGQLNIPAIMGSDGNGITIARFLKTNSSTAQLLINRSFESSYTVCTGCASGCFLRHVDFDGVRVPYCDEGSCYYNCSKSESF